jgi:hypothetical protein
MEYTCNDIVGTFEALTNHGCIYFLLSYSRPTLLVSYD